MSFESVVGSIADKLSTTGELIIDATTVTAVRVLLADATHELEAAQAKMPAIPAGSVGSSYWGSQLAHHSLLAHDHLLDTIKELNSGLDKYEQAMQVLLHNTFGADEANAAMFRKGDAYVDDATTYQGSHHGSHHGTHGRGHR